MSRKGRMMKLTHLRKDQNGRPPRNRDPALETYVRAVRDYVQQSLDQGPKYHPDDNLTSQERKALLSLRSRSNLIIKPVDKGSATVVMLRQDYLHTE